MSDQHDARGELSQVDGEIAGVVQALFPIIDKYMSGHDRVQRLGRLLDERQVILGKLYPEQARAKALLSNTKEQEGKTP